VAQHLQRLPKICRGGAGVGSAGTGSGRGGCLPMMIQLRMGTRCSILLLRAREYQPRVLEQVHSSIYTGTAPAPRVAHVRIFCPILSSSSSSSSSSIPAHLYLGLHKLGNRLLNRLVVKALERQLLLLAKVCVPLVSSQCGVREGGGSDAP
jgi:hypothetical protein